MKIVLNRDDIEEAINNFVKDKFMPYGDPRELVIVQGTKASAVVTFKQEAQLPGLEDGSQDEPVDTDDLDMNEEPERETTPNPMPHDKIEGPFPGV